MGCGPCSRPALSPDYTTPVAGDGNVELQNSSRKQSFFNRGRKVKGSQESEEMIALRDYLTRKPYRPLKAHRYKIPLEEVSPTNQSYVEGIKRSSIIQSEPEECRMSRAIGYVGTLSISDIYENSENEENATIKSIPIQSRVEYYETRPVIITTDSEYVGSTILLQYETPSSNKTDSKYSADVGLLSQPQQETQRVHSLNADNEWKELCVRTLKQLTELNQATDADSEPIKPITTSSSTVFENAEQIAHPDVLEIPEHGGDAGLNVDFRDTAVASRSPLTGEGDRKLEERVELCLRTLKLLTALHETDIFSQDMYTKRARLSQVRYLTRSDLTIRSRLLDGPKRKSFNTGAQSEKYRTALTSKALDGSKSVKMSANILKNQINLESAHRFPTVKLRKPTVSIAHTSFQYADESRTHLFPRDKDDWVELCVRTLRTSVITETTRTLEPVNVYTAELQNVERALEAAGVNSQEPSKIHQSTTFAESGSEPDISDIMNRRITMRGSITKETFAAESLVDVKFNKTEDKSTTQPAITTERRSLHDIAEMSSISHYIAKNTKITAAMEVLDLSQLEGLVDTEGAPAAGASSKLASQDSEKSLNIERTVSEQQISNKMAETITMTESITGENFAVQSLVDTKIDSLKEKTISETAIIEQTTSNAALTAKQSDKMAGPIRMRESITGENFAVQSLVDMKLDSLKEKTASKTTVIEQTTSNAALTAKPSNEVAETITMRESITGENFAVQSLVDTKIDSLKEKTISETAVIEQTTSNAALTAKQSDKMAGPIRMRESITGENFAVQSLVDMKLDSLKEKAASKTAVIEQTTSNAALTAKQSNDMVGPITMRESITGENFAVQSLVDAKLDSLKEKTASKTAVIEQTTSNAALTAKQSDKMAGPIRMRESITGENFAVQSLVDMKLDSLKEKTASKTTVIEQTTSNAALTAKPSNKMAETITMRESITGENFAVQSLVDMKIDSLKNMATSKTAVIEQTTSNAALTAKQSNKMAERITMRESITGENFAVQSLVDTKLDSLKDKANSKTAVIEQTTSNAALTAKQSNKMAETITMRESITGENFAVQSLVDTKLDSLQDKANSKTAVIEQTTSNAALTAKQSTKIAKTTTMRASITGESLAAQSLVDMTLKTAIIDETTSNVAGTAEKSVEKVEPDETMTNQAVTSLQKLLITKPSESYSESDAGTGHISRSEAEESSFENESTSGSAITAESATRREMEDVTPEHALNGYASNIEGETEVHVSDSAERPDLLVTEKASGDSQDASDKEQKPVEQKPIEQANIQVYQSAQPSASFSLPREVEQLEVQFYKSSKELTLPHAPPNSNIQQPEFGGQVNEKIEPALKVLGTSDSQAVIQAADKLYSAEAEKEIRYKAEEVVKNSVRGALQYVMDHDILPVQSNITETKQNDNQTNETASTQAAAEHIHSTN